SLVVNVTQRRVIASASAERSGCRSGHEPAGTRQRWVSHSGTDLDHNRATNESGGKAAAIPLYSSERLTPGKRGVRTRRTAAGLTAASPAGLESNAKDRTSRTPKGPWIRKVSRYGSPSLLIHAVGFNRRRPYASSDRRLQTARGRGARPCRE